MTWNYRVFKRYWPEAPDHEPYYSIHEVYYHDIDEDEDDFNNILGYIDDDKSAWGIDVEELRWVLNAMLSACDKPVIDVKELEEHFEYLRSLPQPPEEEYEVFNSAEELLAALDSWEDEGGNGTSRGQR